MESRASPTRGRRERDRDVPPEERHASRSQRPADDNAREHRLFAGGSVRWRRATRPAGPSIPQIVSGSCHRTRGAGDWTGRCCYWTGRCCYTMGPACGGVGGKRVGGSQETTRQLVGTRPGWRASRPSASVERRSASSHHFHEQPPADVGVESELVRGPRTRTLPATVAPGPTTWLWRSRSSCSLTVGPRCQPSPERQPAVCVCHERRSPIGSQAQCRRRSTARRREPGGVPSGSPPRAPEVSNSRTPSPRTLLGCRRRSLHRSRCKQGRPRAHPGPSDPRHSRWHRPRLLGR